MSKTRAPKRDSWTVRESILAFVPGNSVYKTMRARNARHGVMFILPLIVGFLAFMLRPLIQSLIMSMSAVNISQADWPLVGLENYKYALTVDPYFNQYLVEEIPRMAINAVATLVLSFVIAVILNQDFKGRTLARAIFFLPVILSSGVLPGIESQNEFYNMMQGISEEVANASGVDISAALVDLLSVSGVGGAM